MSYMTRPTEIKRMLECIITDQDRLNFSKAIAKAVSDKARKEDNLKSFSTQLKSEIQRCEGDINSLSEKLNSGKEYRDVVCSVIYDWQEFVKRIVRIDTGEQIDVDIIPEKERQEHLNLFPREESKKDEVVEPTINQAEFVDITPLAISYTPEQANGNDSESVEEGVS
jgi:hypothetical protein